jgi:hypothetical protein
MDRQTSWSEPSTTSSREGPRGWQLRSICGCPPVKSRNCSVRGRRRQKSSSSARRGAESSLQLRLKFLVDHFPNSSPSGSNWRTLGSASFNLFIPNDGNFDPTGNRTRHAVDTDAPSCRLRRTRRQSDLMVAWRLLRTSLTGSVRARALRASCTRQSPGFRGRARRS